MKIKMNKRGVIDQLGALGIGIASLAITLVVVFLIISNVRSNTLVAADYNASNATVTLQAAASTIPGWVPLIVIVAIGGLILALIRIFQ